MSHEPHSGAPVPIDPYRLGLLRETVTMALYISLSLLAVLLATPTPADDTEKVKEALIILFTGLGLVAAHHLAFRMSSRLVNSGLLTQESMHALKAQAAGGIPIAVVAAVPVLLFGIDPGTLIAEILLLGIVCLVGWRAVRQAVSRRRAVGYLLSTVAVAAGIIALKVVVGH